MRSKPFQTIAEPLHRATPVKRATSVARDILVHHQPEPVESDLATEIRRIAEVAR